ncbi:MAG: hypothetical protein HETSPECPRED_010136 [Heterodermia speciosa]|uniref:Major facilitator superfamily (MFS) profile domain-containing protein n=1 Tax=Heterodermia speciosa TaxID=116794 RepID=A0A8H3ES62_9LECA|nr:MAG: hypothetical protein HETSPECPRED_010136 [Heterodermia speciosa]
MDDEKALGKKMSGDSLGKRPGRYDELRNDPEMEGLTLYEKKALLVNRELDSHGMGKYQVILQSIKASRLPPNQSFQWCIFFLCGFGYLLDLMYAQAFGLVAPALQNELGFPDSQYANIFSSFNAGLCAGAFVWGVLVDIIGRQYAFNLTVLIAAIFGLCLGAPSNYDGILVLTAFNGFGIGGNIPIDTTICLEFIPQNRRFLLALLSVFQPLGVVVASGIAYGLVPKYACAVGPDGTSVPACSKVGPGEACCTKASNMGWRYTLFTLGAICLFIFFLRFIVFRFQESPKYLLYRGKDEKAVKVLHHIAKFNGRESAINMEMFSALTDEDSSVGTRDTGTPMLGAGSKQIESSLREKAKLEVVRYKILFSTSQMARLTILVWIIYMFDYWGFSIAGSYLPKILLVKNTAIKLTTAQTYRDFVIIYICGIPGVLLGALMYGVPRVGRKWAMVASSALMAVSFFVYTTVNSEASNIGLNLMEYFFQR